MGERERKSGRSKTDEMESSVEAVLGPGVWAKLVVESSARRLVTFTLSDS